LAKDGATLMNMTPTHPPAGATPILRQVVVWALILAWGLALSGAASAADGLVHAKNFQADAKRRLPVMVLFSAPGCTYCDRVKREYLIPMHKDPAYRNRVLFREVTVDSTAQLTGFDGMRITEGQFAAANKVFIVPTVMVFDTHGRPTGDAIVGLLIPDFYSGYLEAAIDEGLSRIRGK
jgi:thioredoxin-related protein